MNRRHLTALALALLVNVALWGCGNPKPFPEGKATNPPPGCETLRERGGEC